MENIDEIVDNEAIQKTEVTSNTQNDDSVNRKAADTVQSEEIEEPVNSFDSNDDSRPQNLYDENKIKLPSEEIVPNETKSTIADIEKTSNVPESVKNDSESKSSDGMKTLKGGEIDFGSNAPGLDKKDEEMVASKVFFKESLENHPYKQVLTNFEPNAEQLSVSDVELPKSLQQTPLHEINKIDDLEKLVNDLKQEKEIGVDVEWSDHGYKAVTCLLQVSTKNDDYIIDAIDLKDHMLLLNEVFTNPGIVKIFHAATNDLKWLQQDFDLFIINMFDLQRAMKALGYPKLGLEVLLQNYAVVKDKSMQRVDFRKRPLPPKYKDYARTDSHFLIHIYHNLKNELIQANLLGQVLSECNNDCKVVYEKVTDVSYQSIRDEIVKMHQRQLLALEKLNKWRHSVAEYVDINTGHVLSKANMKALVLQMPTDPATIVRICKSDYVKQHLQEVVKVMVEARGQKPQGFTQSESFGQKFGRKRKLDETTFSGDDRGGRRSFYHDDGNRSRKKEFDLRNTLGRGATFRRNRNNRRGFQR